MIPYYPQITCNIEEDISIMKSLTDEDLLLTLQGI